MPAKPSTPAAQFALEVQERAILPEIKAVRELADLVVSHPNTVEMEEKTIYCKEKTNYVRRVDDYEVRVAQYDGKLDAVIYTHFPLLDSSWIIDQDFNGTCD